MSTLAIQNSFPNWAHTAELELTRRLRICAERLSIDIEVVETSREIADCTAEFLLSLHEVSPKLTGLTTVGALWNPPSGIRQDPTRCDFITSFDGYLSGSASVTDFLVGQTSRFQSPPKPIADFRFLPSSPRNIAHATTHDALVYLGVHWDGPRHGDFLDELVGQNLIQLYGPEAAWRHAGEAYRGGIPFDGVSVIQRLAQHGIVLCLHRDAHVNDDTPSMRLFEAASAGCLIISDAIPFARDTFGEAIFILPDGAGRAAFVRDKLAWARGNPGKARDMANACRAIFDKHWALDALLPKVVRFGRDLSIRSKRKNTVKQLLQWSDTIDVFCAIDEFDEVDLKAAIQTLNHQSQLYIRLILISQSDGKRVDLSDIKPRFGISLIKILGSEDSLFLNAIKMRQRAKFFTWLRRDFRWSNNHLLQLRANAEYAPLCQLLFARCILIANDGVHLKIPNFNGDLGRSLCESSRALLRLPPVQNDDPVDENELLRRSDWLARYELIFSDKFAGSTPASSGTVCYSSYITCFKISVTAEEIPEISFVG